MKAFWIILASLFTLIVITLATFFLIEYFKEKPSGIFVDSSPESNVYIDGIPVGKSPYRGSLAVGEVDLKLIPNSGNEKLLPYETKITLAPGIETVVRREFGLDEDKSSGDIMTFDKTGSTDASLVVISTPNYAKVSIDGMAKGFTPYDNSSVSSAEHQIIVSAPGYSDRTVNASTRSGYRLYLFIKLAKSQGGTLVVAPSPTPKVYIQILTTPTGSLRMRTKPGAEGEEIAELKSGDKYLYLDTDVATGWYQIQYQPSAPGLPNGITGWISNDYSKKIEGN